MIPYCTSDLFIGQNVDALQRPFNQSDGSTFVFAGNIVMREIFTELKDQYDFNSATEVVFAGSSAGSIGVLNHIQTVKNFTSAKLSILLDSGWIIDFNGIATDRLFTVEAKSLSRSHVLPACQIPAPNGLPCCVVPSCMLQNSTFVPRDVAVLMVVSSYDLFMLQQAIEKPVDGKALTYSSATDLIASYGGAMNQSLAVLRDLPHVSLIQAQCSQHTYLVSTSLWERPEMTQYAVRRLKFLDGFVEFSHSIRR